MEQIELHEVIGRGTTTDIHRATWRGLEAAVKWVRLELFAANPSVEAFFAQEADLLSRQDTRTCCAWWARAWIR
jgi:serine/threonine-protein kinase TNNI3K